MNAIIHTVEQRSDEWRQVRAGRLTGSCADALLAERKRGSGELAVRRNLRAQLVVERLTGIPVDDGAMRGAAMQHGIETETAAFRAYEARTGRLVKRSGFLSHPTMLAGCSLDGYVGDYTGILELKCPTSAVHLGYLRAGVLPDEYRGQIIHNLWMTGAQWCDFVSYDDRFIDPSLRVFVVRVNAADVDLAAYELLARLFLSEVDRELADVAGMVAA